MNIKNKEAFIEKYKLTEEGIVILETVDRHSGKANDIVNEMYRQSYDKCNWASITGGVPPQFVFNI